MLRRALALLWVLPNSVLGVALGAIGCAFGGNARVVDGVLEVHGRLLAWGLRNATLVPGGVAAITFGHVVLGRDAVVLTATRAHERAHVRQYERWGIFFLPAYACASVVAALCGGRAYADNAFERQARRVAGE